jgi:hypothetical protein
MVQARIVLSADRARQLRQLAEVQHISEDELVSRALELFFRLTERSDAEGVREDWSALSTEALSRIWDNAEDAAYDNWQEMYGIAAQ